MERNDSVQVEVRGKGCGIFIVLWEVKVRLCRWPVGSESQGQVVIIKTRTGKSVPKNKQTHLHLRWPEGKYNFGVNYFLKKLVSISRNRLKSNMPLICRSKQSSSIFH